MRLGLQLITLFTHTIEKHKANPQVRGPYNNERSGGGVAPARQTAAFADLGTQSRWNKAENASERIKTQFWQQCMYAGYSRSTGTLSTVQIVGHNRQRRGRTRRGAIGPLAGRDLAM